MSRYPYPTLTRRSAFMGALAVACAPYARARQMVGGHVKAVDAYGRLKLRGGGSLVLSELELPRIGQPFHEQSISGLRALTVGRDVTGVSGVSYLKNAKGALGLSSVGPSGKMDMDIGEEMLRLGLARYRPRDDCFDRPPQEPLGEVEAREAERGLWGEPAYRIKSPDANVLAQWVETYQIVEGVVTEAERRGDQLFLNFGADYRTDFTAVLDRNTASWWAGLTREDPAALAGARVQVRGFVELVNGPSMWLESACALVALQEKTPEQSPGLKIHTEDER